ncbi:MAG: phosphopantothenoylcysteine decarboxylase [Candidatus Omnitrophica bacterium]|nr:phosphopantothenoylcysteine decarboxylase [Candidatus Omnitrophota bacterium]
MTAGPTREPIDPVRFMSNYSTGAMGAALASEALRRGHRVTVIHGPISEPLPLRVRRIAVEQAIEMERALRAHARAADVVIMAAAVADFRPARRARHKLKRRAHGALILEATPDIIARLPRCHGQLRVGFAVETDRVAARAREKARTKDLDLILAQHVARPSAAQRGPAAPFGRTKIRAWLLERSVAVRALGRISKRRAAGVLLDKIEALWYGQHNHANVA